MSDINVLINGVPVRFEDTSPIIVDGRTLVPIRGVFEELGFEVGWIESARMITLTRGRYKLRITIGSPVFTRTISPATESTTLPVGDVPAQIINGRTMMPVRFPLEAVGHGVFWDGSTRTVNISLQPTISPTGHANPRPDMIGFNHWVVPTSTTATDGLRGFGGMGFINERWHMGSDFYNSNGRDVGAVADGLVMRTRLRVFQDRPRVYSQAAIIRHEGPFTVREIELPYIFSAYQVYGPDGGSRALFVQPGDTVTAGQLIARNGTLPLHFEVRRPSDNTPDEPDDITIGILNSARSIDWDYHIDPRWIFTDHTREAFNRR